MFLHDILAFNFILTVFFRGNLQNLFIIQVNLVKLIKQQSVFHMDRVVVYALAEVNLHSFYLEPAIKNEIQVNWTSPI